MSNWTDVPQHDKAEFIRYYIANPYTLVKGTKDARVYQTLNFRISFAANQYPSQDEMLDFRFRMLQVAPQLFDNLKFGLLGTVTDEEIENLAGTSPSLRSNEQGLAFYHDNQDARNTGLAKKKLVRVAEEQAITSPTAFIAERNKRIAEIDQEALDVYRKSKQIYTFKYQFSEREADKKAKEDMEAYRERLIEKLDITYGGELEKKAKKHLVSLSK